MLYPSCNSWYIDASIPGEPRGFLPLPDFSDHVDKYNMVAANDCEGFRLSRTADKTHSLFDNTLH
ncbi:MAG: hypothetical protein DRR04_06510 [Gammaproteobacteria bacterium]|nr:MAG: hypothetical protein DRQ98_03690 [Gammaproteobacteria bacterium]RLA60133.1 MAG: hypothetical protein DRR04_06510 [Gammaproteobacteria bacterium]